MPKLIVTSRPETFRRAGLKFTRTEQTLEVSEKVLKTLTAEKNLRVVVVKEPKAPKNAAKKKDN